MAQSLNYLYSERSRLFQEIFNLRQQLAYAESNGNPAIISGLQARLASAQELLAVVNAQIQAGEADQRLPTASAGNLARDDQQATVSGSRTQAPSSEPQVLTPEGRIQPAPDTTSGTNALEAVSPTSVDTGTDAETRPLTQTQATPQPSALIPFALNDDSGYALPGTPSLNIGVGALGDDAGTKNATRTEVDAIFNEPFITPQPNVLDQYASYTYTASVYLMNKLASDTIQLTKRKSTTGCELLFQSGGAGPQGRNEFFSNDYYIDRIDLKSKIVGKGTGLTHNVTDIQMTITEPNGISLIDNLDKAAQKIWGKDKKKTSFTSMVYLLVIRFYGYDDQGNLVQGGVASPDGSSDPNAFVEKFYPFLITKLGFKIASKLVEYDLQCKALPSQINVSTQRGTIPFNIELSGQTLRELLSGPAQSYGAPTPDSGDADAQEGGFYGAPLKANAATSAKLTVRQGLMDALNQYQQQLVEQKKQEFADEYSVVFETDAIASARLKKSGTTVKKNTSNNSGGTPADQKLPNKQAMDPTTRTVAATAGLQIIQFIDQVCKNSSYLEDQQVVKYDEETQQYLYNGTPAQNVAWFKINLECQPMTDKMDNIRNDFAYKIKYIISPYKLSNLYSPYFPQPKFNGVQKQYNYWFTGQNTSVLQYEETLNNLYYVVMSGSDFSDISANANDLLKFSAQTNSAESSQGAQGKTNEPVANASEQLFSPTDLKECSMTIVGDPAWLQQGEAFAGFVKNNPNRYKAFLADGTINFDSQQVLFEVAFNKPTDYNFSTGIMDPNAVGTSNYGTAQPTAGSSISRVYIAYECLSNFKEGKFTQQLKGKLMLFPTKNPKSNPAPQKATAKAIPSPVTNVVTSIEYDLMGNPITTNTEGAAFQTPSFGGIFQSFTNAVNAVKTAPPPQAPTSSGQPVGVIATNPSGAAPAVVNNPQVMAASDDAE